MNRPEWNQAGKKWRDDHEARPPKAVLAPIGEKRIPRTPNDLRIYELLVRNDFVCPTCHYHECSGHEPPQKPHRWPREPAAPTEAESMVMALASPRACFDCAVKARPGSLDFEVLDKRWSSKHGDGTFAGSMPLGFVTAGTAQLMWRMLTQQADDRHKRLFSESIQRSCRGLPEGGREPDELRECKRERMLP